MLKTPHRFPSSVEGLVLVLNGRDWCQSEVQVVYIILSIRRLPSQRELRRDRVIWKSFEKIVKLYIFL